MEMEGGLFMPWFLEVDNLAWATTNVASLSPLAMPTDFLRPMEFMLFWWNQNNVYTNPGPGQQVANPWVNVIRDTDYGVINARWVGLGSPQKYYLKGSNNLLIYPPSDKAYQLRLRYWGAQPTLSTNIENAWSKYAPDVLASKAGLAISAKVLKDGELVTVFANDLKIALQRLQVHHEAREHADANYEMGDN